MSAYQIFVLAAVILILLVVPVLATQAAEIRTSTVPTSVSPGNSGYVTLSITNTGTETIERAKVILSSADSHLDFGPFSVKELGSIGGGKSTSSIISFSVPSSTPSGFYTAEFRIEACYGSTCTVYSQVALVNVQSPSTLQITSVSPDTLKIGSDTTVNFTLFNSGDDSIGNIVMTWSANDSVLPRGTSNQLFVNSLAAKSSTQLQVPVLVNPSAKSGVYTFMITAEYTDSTGTKQTTDSTVGFMIAGNYNWIVTLDSQGIVPPGGSGTASIKISNGGSQEALYMTMKASSTKLSVTPALIYIGSIDADDWDTEDLTIKANVVPGTYPITVGLDWKDTFGQSYSETYDIDVEVSNAAKSSWWTAPIIIIIVAAAIWYVVRRKKSKR